MRAIALIAGILIMTAIACTSPVDIYISEDRIKVGSGDNSAAVALENITFHGLENLPTPTPEVATSTPIALPTPDSE